MNSKFEFEMISAHFRACFETIWDDRNEGWARKPTVELSENIHQTQNRLRNKGPVQIFEKKIKKKSHT